MSPIILEQNEQYISSVSNLETRLTVFIRWALRQSYFCKADEAMNLLDEAWSAQKLVWQLRNDTISD